MMNLFYTVNSGIYLRSASFGIFIDGIHRGEQIGFSAVPQSVRTALRTHSAPFDCSVAFLFTHAHPDHYDPKFLASVASSDSVYGPGFGCLPSQTLGPGIRQLLLPEGRVYAFQSPHQGSGFSSVAHHALLVGLEHHCLLIAGDGELSPELAGTIHAFCPHGADAVCVNPYHLLSPDSRSFLALLRPRFVLLSHLPFPQDDKLGCHTLAKRAVAVYPPDFPPLTQLAPMSWLQLPLHS